MAENFPINQAKDVLLDTNIIQYFFSRPNDLAKQILQHLAVVKAVGSIISISDITLYELISGSNISNENKALQAIEGLKRFSVEADILTAGARLACLYIQKKVNDPEIGDNIIAATCLLRECIIYSCDKNGFPEPFFDKIDERKLSYKDSAGKNKAIKAYFFVPNKEQIGQEFEKRTKQLNLPIK